MTSVRKPARESWFAASRELDKTRYTDLGTFGHLPWELRRTILVYLGYLEFKTTSCLTFGGWEFRSQSTSYDRIEEFEKNVQAIRVYRDDSERPGQWWSNYKGEWVVNEPDKYRAISCLGQSSESLKQEIYSVLLATHNLYFNFVSVFWDFFSSPSMLRAQHETRASLTISIFPMESDFSTHKRVLSEDGSFQFQCIKIEQWHQAFDCLPSNLRFLALDLHYVECNNDTAERLLETWKRHMHELGMLLKKARRQAPGAKIVVSLTFRERTVTWTRPLKGREPPFTKMVNCVNNLVEKDEMTTVRSKVLS